MYDQKYTHIGKTKPMKNQQKNKNKMKKPKKTQKKQESLIIMKETDKTKIHCINKRKAKHTKKKKRKTENR